MRNEDASQAGLNSGATLNARDDIDHLAAADYGPATGNAISGSGTVTGATGTDMVGSAQGRITAIEGAGGSDSSFSGGKLEVQGQYGKLTIDAQGNYSYERDPGTPAGVSDVFTYTLANQAGATDAAKLIINIGDVPMLAGLQGTRVVPGPDGVVTLPPGVSLSDVRVVGRDLVVTLPDGSTMIIVDGAIFVPRLVIDGVEVPASNLAALLIDSEPRPAVGDLTPAQQSSGGNFEQPVPPLDPGVPLGDLLPPTELDYTPPEFEEIGDALKDNDPPVILGSSIAVSEEGLAAGLPDDNPGPPQDTTNLAVRNGTVTISDPDGDALIVTLGAPPEGLTSKGVAITWVLSNNGHLLTGSAGNTPVITISITDAGAYTITLLAQIDHPTGNGENTAALTIPVTVSDGEKIATGSIAVQLEDDSPNASSAQAASSITFDETVAGTPAGFPKSVTSADPMIAGIGGAFGADGPAAANSQVLGLTLTGGVSSLASGMFTSAGHQAITLVQTNATTITGTYGAGLVAFTLVINPNGTVTYTQNVPLDHVTDGSDAIALNDTNTPLTFAGLVNATVTLTDFDGDSSSASVPIGDRIRIFDDGPSIGLGQERVEPVLTVDDTALGTDSSASFAGLFTSSFGADGSGAVTYALAITAGASGLVDVQTNEAVNLVLNGGVVEGRSALTNQLVFTVSVDAAGVVKLDQLRAVKHDDPNDPFETGASAAGLSADGLIRLIATITDQDGDKASASVDIGSNLKFLDDGPSIINTVTDPLNIDNDADPSGTGTFAYNLGNDGAKLNNDVISVSNFSILINGVAASNVVLTADVNGAGVATPETAASASYRFTFEYPNGDGTTASGVGTLVFNKSAQTYTVTLTSGPIEGFSLVSTSDVGNVFNEVNSQVTVVQLEPDLFVQFTGVATASNPGSLLNTANYSQDATPPNDGAAQSFSNGELFSQSAADVQVSSTFAGVNGNTIQGGEVIDFNLYNTNPGATTGGTPTQFSSSMFIQLDGIGTDEDLIVVLKLWNPLTNEYTTKAVIVTNADIYKFDGGGYPATQTALAGSKWAALATAIANSNGGNNDGLIIIESNDYNGPGENWVIVGGQIAGSEKGVTGTGIDLNRAVDKIGQSGDSDADNNGSLDTQSFSADTHDGPFKIGSIGFEVVSTTDQNATIEFDVTVTDGDGDSATRTAVTVQIGTPPVVLDMDGDGVEFLDRSAGVAYDYGDGLVATGWAGADDAILVRDANLNGTVDDATEFVFGGNGLTDMEALRAQYGDTLDAADADFAQFKVWRDANSNGKVDDGELVSLGDAGIASISLVSDGQSYTAANGDVVVAGSSTFTRTDGSTGTAADALFATGSAKSTQEVERIAANSNNTVLAAAVAAAGLAAAAPAAADGPAGGGAQHNAIAAIEAAPLALAAEGGTETALGALMSGSIGNETGQIQIGNLPAAAKGSDPIVGHLSGDVPAGDAPSDAIEATDPAAPLSAPAAGAEVALASVEMLAAMGGEEGAKHHAIVEKIVAEALDGGGAADLDALLNALPAQESGGNAGLEVAASLADGAVSNGDSAHMGAFMMAAIDSITTEAIMLHQDALQPVANG